MDGKTTFIDQTPRLTQVKQCLTTSSEESDQDSCHKQGYDYDHDAVDMLKEDDSLSASGSSNSKQGRGGKCNDEHGHPNDNHDSDSDNESGKKEDNVNNSNSSRDEGSGTDNEYDSDNEYTSNDESNGSVESDSDESSTANKGAREKPRGRPVGSGMNEKFQCFKKETEAKYKIVCRYINEVPEAKDMGLSKRELFDTIRDQEVEEAGLQESFVFHYETALSRIRRKKLKGDGTFSPLTEIEPQLVQLVVCMSKIKRSLTMTEGLHLCNELITGTEIQQRLLDFKISRNIYAESLEALGRVGRHYWKKFLKRNRNELRAKPGRKFALDRSSWSTIMNFSDMYDHVESVMVDSNIAHKLETPQWVDRSGNIVENEEDSQGCKVEVSIDCPDCAIVMDEVGCNLSQDCDNRVGGELYLTGRQDEAYKSISTRHQHFTVLGLTALDG